MVIGISLQSAHIESKVSPLMLAGSHYQDVVHGRAPPVSPKASFEITGKASKFLLAEGDFLARLSGGRAAKGRA
jgi:hypothetical protein